MTQLLLNPGYTLDPLTGEFAGPDQKPVSPAEMREAVDAIVKAAKAQAVQLVARLRKEASEGRSDALARFEGAMALLIAALHKAASGAAVGDLQGIWRKAEADLREAVASERAHLIEFVGLIASLLRAGGSPMLETKGNYVTNRAASYMDAGLMTYERQRLMLYKFLDFTEGMRELKPGGEHCAGCEWQAGLGWVPIDEFVPLGGEECGQWCECTAHYRKTTPTYLAS